MQPDMAQTGLNLQICPQFPSPCPATYGKKLVPLSSCAMFVFWIVIKTFTKCYDVSWKKNPMTEKNNVQKFG